MTHIFQTERLIIVHLSEIVLMFCGELHRCKPRCILRSIGAAQNPFWAVWETNMYLRKHLCWFVSWSYAFKKKLFLGITYSCSPTVILHWLCKSRNRIDVMALSRTFPTDLVFSCLLVLFVLIAMTTKCMVKNSDVWTYRW